MRLCRLLALASLVAARPLRAQDFAVMAQAIPLVTRATPTAGGSYTEGYLSQPALMAHGSWEALRFTGTLNLEGLTLERGELNTGGYGEGYVDRRHPHSYVHEALLGAVGSVGGLTGSLFAGRGFAPFGSDDPMVRPFEKFPVNHHLAQVLERLVTVAAVRGGPVVLEAGVFNGDEPVAPGAPPNLKRFGDSWASRLTLIPVRSLELSGSYARVASPEVRSGGGLDQEKASLVGRYESVSASTARYAMIEYAHTNETNRGAVATRLSSMLAEGSVCRAGVVAAARVERTDRPEEEPLADPFRVPRPATDLTSLGVSRWTIGTFSLSAPRVGTDLLGARPFVEVARIAVAAGDPPGIFDPQLRYGTTRMWMLSAGVRLRAGAMHDRMGRYGVAAPPMHMSMGGADGSHAMSGMTHDDMPDMAMPTAHHSSNRSCTL